MLGMLVIAGLTHIQVKVVEEKPTILSDWYGA
jgi:hypothetical protein